MGGAGRRFGGTPRSAGICSGTDAGACSARVLRETYTCIIHHASYVICHMSYTHIPILIFDWPGARGAPGRISEPDATRARGGSARK